MAFETTPAYAESDADDEYEYDRSVGAGSPGGGGITDSEHSPIDSDMSTSTAEHTPTTYGHRTSADRLPETIITEWNVDDCADFIGSIGLGQYGDSFVENEIVGEALVALHHDDLKSMGITSVGHRLTILKSVYDVKKAQDIPLESDHYQPLSADAEAQHSTATLKDIKHLVEQLRLRDERMNLVEQDMRRMMEDFRRLREDVLPALRLVKDANHPLPNVSSATQGYSFDSLLSPFMGPPSSNMTPTPGSGGSAGGGNSGGGGSAMQNVKRQYSQRKIPIGVTAKSASPTQTTHERSIAEHSLDPANAAERAVLSSSHLAAMSSSNNNNNNSGSNTSAVQNTSAGYPSPNVPSPTSPHNHLSGTTLGSRSYRGDSTTSQRSDMDVHYSYNRDKTISATGPPRRRETPGPDTPGLSGSHSGSTSGGGGGGGGSSSTAGIGIGGIGSGSATPTSASSSSAANSVEIFKSFRVSMDDPCHKILPAALKKYQINAPWDQYALYIVYGDQERCLGLDEKPLILFKQLDKEGKKPMFMLRRTAGGPGGGGGGGQGGGGGGDVRYDPPGGII